jgi:demethylmenaquinone methyltransferase/2-methoxy-6-polyprenyl-1,4-benzoquinol methylase
VNEAGSVKPDELVRRMNEYYAGRAPLHDAYMGYKDNTSMEELLGPIIRWFEAHVEGADVLEVACGTGNWTQVLARRARSVTATDVNRSVLDLAEGKSYASDRVSFKVADAYALEGLDRSFTAAFAADWWSHIPKSRIPVFLGAVCGKLLPGSRVIIVDMLPTRNLTYLGTHRDEEGNLIHPRKLSSGETYEVVKNFPTEQELAACVKGFGRDMVYLNHDGLRRWGLIFTTG